MRVAVIVLMVAMATNIATGMFTNKQKVTHKDMVEESAKFGEKKLKEFKKLNPLRTELEESFEALRQKKGESVEIEEHAIVNLEATKNLMLQTGRCVSDVQADLEFAELWHEFVSCDQSNITCDPTNPYRSENGSCNNLDNPQWGMAFTPQLRFIPSHYEDGIDMPRDYDLPSPRLVSNLLFNNSEGEKYDKRRTAQLMAWGQLIAHDFVLTPVIDGMLNCCDTTKNGDNPACFPIEIPSDDKYFKTPCMNFVRSSPATEGCLPSHREQINEITAYIDGSMLYGSTEKEFRNLREFSGGRMRCTDSDLLPDNRNGTCLKLDKGDTCQAAGDKRVDVLPNLGGNHILLMREHNRIADQLAEINTHWDDEKIFQETRKIIAAEIQHITYAEYLPMVLGDEAMMLYDLEIFDGYDDQYDPTVNAGVRNAFSAAAFRFGHSQIMPEQAYLFHDYVTFDYKRLTTQFMNTHMIRKSNGHHLPDLMRWLSYDKMMGSDRFFEKEVRDLLFLKNGQSTDLAARNLQRGRDHGLPSYSEYREFCGFSAITSWNPNNHDGGLVDHKWKDTRILKDLYETPEEIDLYAGAMSEKNVQGGLVGPTFACLMGEQFRDLKKGDRFWYERPEPNIGFTEGQLKQIKKIKLSKLFCENFGLDQIQKRVFNVVSDWNTMEPCQDLPDINLNHWKENRK